MNGCADIMCLPREIVDEIKKYKEAQFTKDGLQVEFPNPLLREDTLDLLDKYCTVIYYPLEDEGNNGFHVTGIPDKHGNEQHFVFINTAQTIEKQVFTAAHELGHIWKVDEYIQKKYPDPLSNEIREQIINRFAAELLIPEDIFKKSFELEYIKNQSDVGKITVANMLKVIVTMMYQFFAPMKSIVRRCLELNMISESVYARLTGCGNVEKDVIEKKVEEIIRDNGYIRFQEASNKKRIEGLAELLDRAESLGAVSNLKIEKLRNMFDIQRDGVNNDQMNELLN